MGSVLFAGKYILPCCKYDRELQKKNHLAHTLVGLQEQIMYAA